MCQEADFELNDVRVPQHAVIDDFSLDIFVKRILMPWDELDGQSVPADNILAAPNETAGSSIELSH